MLMGKSEHSCCTTCSAMFLVNTYVLAYPPNNLKHTLKRPEQQLSATIHYHHVVPFGHFSQQRMINVLHQCEQLVGQHGRVVNDLVHLSSRGVGVSGGDVHERQQIGHLLGDLEQISGSTNVDFCC